MAKKVKNSSRKSAPALKDKATKKVAKRVSRSKKETKPTQSVSTQKATNSKNTSTKTSSAKNSRSQFAAPKSIQINPTRERNKLQSLLNSVNGIFWEADAQTFQFTFVSGKAEAILGYPIQRWVEEPTFWKDHIHPEDRTWAVDYCASCTLKNQAHDFEYRMTAADGRVVWLHDIVTVESENGIPVLLGGLMVDITERKQAEEKLDTAFKELSRVSNLQESILNALPSNIALINNSGEIVEVNESWRRFGNENNLNSLNQCIGDNYIVIANNATGEEEEFGKKMAKGIEQVLRNTLPSFAMEYPCDSPSVKRWFKAEVTPIIKGQSAGAVIMHIDITDRKLTELRLNEAKEKAEESDRLKTAFLANMRHEIRTPMNAIVGFSKQLAATDILDTKRKEYASIVVNSSSQLLSIVDDIISISLLDTKQEKASNTEVCLNDLLSDLLPVFKSQTEAKNLSLTLTKPLADEQSHITIDKSKLIQIISNLLTNALKFTHKGGIEFGYQVKDKEILFFVKDSGIGVDAIHHEKIFGRFNQADEDIGKKYGGTGLGLSISKALTELLGGKIWIESELGRGSVFYISLPFHPVVVAVKAPPAINTIGGKVTILVAEDEEINFYYLRVVLEQCFSCEILQARNGEEAVELFKNNPHINLVLMDINMPVMDGYEAAKQIKELSRGVHIIAQTGYDMKSTMEKYGNGIFNDYLSKPIDDTILKAKIELLQSGLN